MPLPNAPVSPKQILATWTRAGATERDEVMTWTRGSTLALRNPQFNSEETPLGSGASRSDSEHVKFLADWPADTLSGFDESVHEAAYDPAGLPVPGFDPELDGAVRFVAVELAGEGPRLGSGTEEWAALRGLQSQHPRLRSASLFEVGVLNMKYTGGHPFNYPNGFNDTFARIVELEEQVGEFEDLPAAFIAEDGIARIGGIPNGTVAPLRRAVG
ncbi:MAG TPA: hypothetical protein VFX84_01325 [Candidatus Saccharimonadales bacterium]|nr:hypothetical protein [Candidatus Saccharimonadales bacterium]